MTIQCLDWLHTYCQYDRKILANKDSRWVPSMEQEIISAVKHLSQSHVCGNSCLIVCHFVLLYFYVNTIEFVSCRSSSARISLRTLVLHILQIKILNWCICYSVNTKLWSLKFLTLLRKTKMNQLRNIKLHRMVIIGMLPSKRD